MEIKKSAKADLERGKGLSLLLGLLVALSVVFVGLEWRSAVAQAQTTDRGFNAQEIEDVMNIEDQQKPEEPEPEPQQAQQRSSSLMISRSSATIRRSSSLPSSL